MGFNKKIVGERQIETIKKDLSVIRLFLKADCLIFTSNEIKEKFKSYEKKYNTDRISLI